MVHVLGNRVHNIGTPWLGENVNVSLIANGFGNVRADIIKSVMRALQSLLALVQHLVSQGLI